MAARVRRLALCLLLGAGWFAGAAGLARSSGARASDFWEEVRNPGMRAHGRDMAAGRAALAERQYAQALTAANRARDRHPERADAHVLRALALSGLGHRQDALEAAREALRLDSAAFDAPHEGGGMATTAAEAGDFALAAEILGRLVRMMRPSGLRRFLYALYADVLSALGPEREQDCVRAYQIATRARAAVDPRVAIGLAIALHRRGEVERAAELARSAQRVGDLATFLALLPLPEEERAARLAVAAEAAEQSETASEHWARAAAGGPWAEHASAQLERLNEAAATPPRRGRR
ncbi:MAG: hypothetical protein OEY14_13505 [Myxococcales bacterium]|nr:hypothetical protein [Myxococcales bacterium]